MFNSSSSKQSRASQRAWVSWALFALPGFVAACGDDGSTLIVEISDAGSDAAATEPLATSSDNPTDGPGPSPTTTPSAESSSLPDDATSSPAPTSEPESTEAEPTSGPISVDPTSNPQPTSEPTPTSAPEPSSEPWITSSPSTEVWATTGVSSAAPDETTLPPIGVDSGTSGGDSTLVYWTDGGGLPTDDTEDLDSEPYEAPCGYPIGLSDAGGPPGEWPAGAADGGSFDAGILTNGSFDMGIEGWTSIPNPNGIDTQASFFWQEEGALVSTGFPYSPNAQVFYQDFTVPSIAVSSAAFAFDVLVASYYEYNMCLQDVETLEPWYLVPHDTFRVDIVASEGEMFADAGVDPGGDASANTVSGDAGAAMPSDAGVYGSDAGLSAIGDAAVDGGVGSPTVFTTPVLFPLFVPRTATYGVQHIVFDGEELAAFLDSHRGETLRLRFGVVSSSFPVMAAFDNVSLHLGM